MEKSIEPRITTVTPCHWVPSEMIDARFWATYVRNIWFTTLGTLQIADFTGTMVRRSYHSTTGVIAGEGCMACLAPNANAGTKKTCYQRNFIFRGLEHARGKSLRTRGKEVT